MPCGLNLNPNVTSGWVNSIIEKPGDTYTRQLYCPEHVHKIKTSTMEYFIEDANDSNDEENISPANRTIGSDLTMYNARFFVLFNLSII